MVFLLGNTGVIPDAVMMNSSLFSDGHQTWNLTANDTSYQYVISTSQVSFLITMATLIITSNAVVLLVHHITPTLHMPMSVFVKSLACADLWVGVNCALNIGVTYAGGWPYGLATCKLIGYLLLVVVMVSITSLTCMSVERYLAIQNPIGYRTVVSYRRMCLCVVGLWVCCGATFLPAFFDWGMDVDIRGSCTLFWRYNVSFGFFLISLLIIPNLLVSVVCYMCILHTMCARHRWLQATASTYASSSGQQPHQTAGQRQQERILAKIGLAVLSAFYITWLPYVAASFLRYLNLASIPAGLYNGTLYLGISNSFLNCIIYSISHEAFRDGLKTMVKKCCCHKPTQKNKYTGSSPLNSSRRTTASNSPSTFRDTSLHIQSVEHLSI